MTLELTDELRDAIESFQPIVRIHKGACKGGNISTVSSFQDDLKEKALPLIRQSSFFYSGQLKPIMFSFLMLSLTWDDVKHFKDIGEINEHYRSKIKKNWGFCTFDWVDVGINCLCGHQHIQKICNIVLDKDGSLNTVIGSSCILKNELITDKDLLSSIGEIQKNSKECKQLLEKGIKVCNHCEKQFNFQKVEDELCSPCLTCGCGKKKQPKFTRCYTCNLNDKTKVCSKKGCSTKIQNKYITCYNCYFVGKNSLYT